MATAAAFSFLRPDHGMLWYADEDIDGSGTICWARSVNATALHESALSRMPGGFCAWNALGTLTREGDKVHHFVWASASMLDDLHS
eukprot:scaffold209821_cov20-Prasinocladus_malaysianus.AAC.1